jgi:hypothetical protein
MKQNLNKFSAPSQTVRSATRQHTRPQAGSNNETERPGCKATQTRPNLPDALPQPPFRKRLKEASCVVFSPHAIILQTSNICLQHKFGLFVATPCEPGSFGGTYGLCLQSRTVNQWYTSTAPRCSLAYYLTLKMERLFHPKRRFPTVKTMAIFYSETLGCLWTIWTYNPEDELFMKTLVITLRPFLVCSGLKLRVLQLLWTGDRTDALLFLGPKHLLAVTKHAEGFAQNYWSCLSAYCVAYCP